MQPGEFVEHDEEAHFCDGRSCGRPGDNDVAERFRFERRRTVAGQTPIERREGVSREWGLAGEGIPGDGWRKAGGGRRRLGVNHGDVSERLGGNIV